MSKAIELAHTHKDGKECFLTDSKYSNWVHISLRGKTFWAAYMQYTGSYYAFDISTGKETAHFTREFFETFLKPLIISELVIDPNCKPLNP